MVRPANLDKIISVRELRLLLERIREQPVEEDMKIKFLSLVSACALFWLIQDHYPTAALAESIVKSEFTVTTSSAYERTQHADGGSEYYVDCAAAEMKGDGRSPASAWHSLDAINARTFSAGDTIYLKRGTDCHGLLWPKGSGTASAAIRLSAYGKGMRPRVIAANGDEEAFKLFDQEYWEVDSIDFSGGRLFGVFVSGHGGILHHIHLRNRQRRGARWPRGIRSRRWPSSRQS